METAISMKSKTLRDSFLNMLGEFVALNKSPDFKLNSQSNNYLAEAIRDEIRKQYKHENVNMFNQSYPCSLPPKHKRTNSTQSNFFHNADAEFVNPSESKLKPQPKPVCNQSHQSLSSVVPSNPPILTPNNGFFQRFCRASKSEEPVFVIKSEKSSTLNNISKTNTNKLRTKKQKLMLAEMDESRPKVKL